MRVSRAEGPAGNSHARKGVVGVRNEMEGDLSVSPNPALMAFQAWSSIGMEKNIQICNGIGEGRRPGRK